MNVLSLFDGLSSGQIALQKLGVIVDNYYASEIDKYAIEVTQINFPNTIQLGDVSKINAYDLPKIDLLIGGSPCQGFSFAGNNLNFDDERSKLFFEYSRLLRELRPKHFLLENVKMTQESQDIISDFLGVQPIEINSGLVSAQNRRRLYWTNVKIEQPEDESIYFKDVIETGADCYYITPKMWRWIGEDERMGKFKIYDGKIDEKMQMLEASHHKGISNQRCFAIRDSGKLRYISPLECERLQNVPDNYTSFVSNTQRYKMLGNGWTVNVISHIFKEMDLPTKHQGLVSKLRIGLAILRDKPKRIQLDKFKRRNNEIL